MILDGKICIISAIKSVVKNVTHSSKQEDQDVLRFVVVWYRVPCSLRRRPTTPTKGTRRDCAGRNEEGNSLQTRNTIIRVDGSVVKHQRVSVVSEHIALACRESMVMVHSRTI